MIYLPYSDDNPLPPRAQAYSNPKCGEALIRLRPDRSVTAAEVALIGQIQKAKPDSGDWLRKLTLLGVKTILADAVTLWAYNNYRCALHIDVKGGHYRTRTSGASMLAILSKSIIKALVDGGVLLSDLISTTDYSLSVGFAPRGVKSHVWFRVGLGATDSSGYCAKLAGERLRASAGKQARDVGAKNEMFARACFIR